MFLPMRKALIAVATVALLLAACAKETTPSSGGASGSSGAPDCNASSMPVTAPGHLTVATDSPAFSPWFRHNDPSNGQGYESAVTYAVAQKMGFAPQQVRWTVEPFAKSFAPGPKHFDFAIEQISITPEREQAVSFSHGYYDDQQALIGVKGTPIAGATTVADLTGYKFAAEQGTTSLQFIAQVIRPTEQPSVFDTTRDAISALQAGQVDGLVLDLPTAAYTQYSVDDGVLIGKFAPTNPPEQFGLLFQKDSTLVACANKAIDALKADGTLEQLQTRWLKSYADVPDITG
jgi:polar amino acid transport system substrate-binding protein